MFRKKSKTSLTDQKPQTVGMPSGPPGKRCYAIGDVHGRLDLLTSLLDKIKADIARSPGPENFIVFLGDLIDRGPDSKGVVELLMSAPVPDATIRCVKGNHEEGLIRALSGETHLLQDWLKHGGFQCAISYGATGQELMSGETDDVLTTLQQCIPRRHLEFLKGFNDTIAFGDYLFVHAGVRPGVPLEGQSPKDLHWIRDDFLTSSEDFGKVIVHGHTIVERVEVRKNRIALDTGAYCSGKLTALRLFGVERAFLTVSGDASQAEQHADWRMTA